MAARSAVARRHAAPRRRTPAGGAGRAALALDRVIHDRTRLGMLSALAVTDALSFVELRRMLGASDGNLSVHARRLEEAGYVSCSKSFSGRVPRTEYRVTAAGRRALEAYLRLMEALIRATKRWSP